MRKGIVRKSLKGTVLTERKKMRKGIVRKSLKG